MTPLLVGLAGSMGTGKSTISSHLRLEHGWQSLAFADPLKNGLCAMFDITREQLEQQKRAGHEIVPGVTARKAMQTLGTEWGRELNQDIWVLALRKQINKLTLWSDLPGIVVDDVRMENEAALIREYGGVVIHVRNGDANAAGDAHLSEQCLHIADNDLTIDNSGSLSDLYAIVERKLRIVIARERQLSRGAA